MSSQPLIEDRSAPPGVRYIPYMGVIYVVHEAHKLGFYNGHPDWCNLGQGQPEVGVIAGAPPRVSSIELEIADHAYGPVGGTDALREAIAAHYNRLFRQGKKQYTKDHVSVASGGRLALSRVFAALADQAVAYQIPDYTAYEDLLQYQQHRMRLVLLTGREENGFAIPAAELRQAIEQQGVRAFIFSNPCNPTGAVVEGAELKEYVDVATRNGCTIVHDEFYSHFIYNPDGTPGSGPISAAQYVEDVDNDPHLLVDGLTKSFRYPGWRVGWVVGPPEMVEMVNRASSAIDGGPSRPVQKAALKVLEPAQADGETQALREVFVRKRELMRSRLTEMGIRCSEPPGGTFYVWACLENLKPPFNDADEFFRAALQHKVMTVPGRFFDVNPGQERQGESPYKHWMRFSFGPPEDNVRMGLDRLQAMLGG
jgi:aspartate/methionine/tyrosine aminotransferase